MSEYTYRIENTLPDRTPEERKREWELLVNNIDLILRNVDIVLSKKEFFFIQLSFAHISTTITGTTALPLGVLLLLWQKNEFIATCPHCGERAFIVFAAGSPLSGSHKYNGFCPACKKDILGSKKTFRELWLPSWELNDKYPNFGIIKKTVNHYFSHGGESKDGITETVIQEKIQGLMLEDLIGVLKSMEL